MTNEHLTDLCSIFKASKIPVAICSKDFTILWNNFEFDLDKCINKVKNNFAEYFEKVPSASSFFDITINNCLYYINATEHDDVLIMELHNIHGSMTNRSVAPVDMVMKNLLIRIRTSVSSIAVAADEIYKSIIKNTGCSSYMATQLNIIEGNLTLLLKDMLVPEQLLSNYLNSETEKLLNVTQLMSIMEKDFLDLFDDGSVEFVHSCEPGIFTWASHNAFKLTICGIISEIMSFDLKIEKITSQVFIDSNDVINIVFCGQNISGDKNSFDDDYVDMYFYTENIKPGDFVRTCFLTRYNASISSSETENSKKIILKIPVDYGDEPQISTTTAYFSSNRRFNPLIASLSHIKKKRRYLVKEKGET